MATYALPSLSGGQGRLRLQAGLDGLRRVWLAMSRVAFCAHVDDIEDKHGDGGGAGEGQGYRSLGPGVRTVQLSSSRVGGKAVGGWQGLPLFIHSFVHSGTVLCTGDTAVNKREKKIPALMELKLGGRGELGVGRLTTNKRRKLNK